MKKRLFAPIALMMLMCLMLPVKAKAEDVDTFFAKAIAGTELETEEKKELEEAGINVSDTTYGSSETDRIIEICNNFTYNGEPPLEVKECGKRICIKLNNATLKLAYEDGNEGKPRVNVSEGGNLYIQQGTGSQSATFEIFSRNCFDVQPSALLTFDGVDVKYIGSIATDNEPIVNNMGEFKMVGSSSVSRNDGEECPGVYNGEGASFTMTSGSKITNCKGMYGAVYNKGTFILDGGEISGTDGSEGGGVYNDKDASFTMMPGSKITNCTAGMGGAVYNRGNFLMIGGTISRNSAEVYGGVYNEGKNAKMTVCGTACVYENGIKDKDPIIAPSNIIVGINPLEIRTDSEELKLTDGAKLYLEREEFVDDYVLVKDAKKYAKYFHLDDNDGGAQILYPDHASNNILHKKSSYRLDVSFFDGKVVNETKGTEYTIMTNDSADTGSIVKLKAVPNKGLIFKKWEGDVISDKAEIEIGPVVKDIKVRAVFGTPESDTTDVIFATGCKAYVPMISVKKGSLLNEKDIKTPVREGYTFKGWYKDAEFKTKWDFAKDKVEGDYLTLYAKWSKNKSTKVKVELLKASTTKSKAVKLSWSKVEGAAYYKVCGAVCGSKMSVLKKSTDKLSFTVKSINKKKIKLHKHYKFYVTAYDKNDKKLAKSITVHYIAGNTKGDEANVTKVTLDKSKLSVKKGKTAKLKVTKTVYGGKKHISKGHGTATYFTSDNPSVATVSSKGVIKGIKKGTATIYVQDNGGAYAKVKVTVK